MTSGKSPWPGTRRISKKDADLNTDLAVCPALQLRPQSNL
jgi:hypothetical protein